MIDGPPPQPATEARARRPAAWALGALLVAGVCLRLPGLASPPTDIHHVRQSDTAEIARNFVAGGIDLLHPRVGWGGEDPVLVESELPAYAALVALGWVVAGQESAAWARGVSVVGWLIGGLGLWLWVRRRLPGPAHAYLVLYALSPLAIAHSRTMQPDALAVGLLLLALERADASAERGIGAALLAGLLGGLAIAGKGSLGFFAFLLPALILARGQRQIGRLACAAVGLVLLPLAWYLHAHTNLTAEGASFGLWGAGSHKWGGAEVWLDVATWRSIGGTLVTQALTPAGLLLAGAGLLEARRQPELRPFALALPLFAVAVLLVTDGFRLHNYYQLALVPFGSVLAGAGLLALLPQADGPAARWALGVTLILLLGLSAALGVGFLTEALRRDTRVEILGLALGVVVEEGNSVVAVDRHPQSLLHAMDRRGWRRSTVHFGEVTALEARGADYLLLTDTSTSWSDLDLLRQLEDGRALAARSQGWLLFRLGRPLVSARPAPRPTAPRGPEPTGTLPAASGGAAEGGVER